MTAADVFGEEWDSALTLQGACEEAVARLTNLFPSTKVDTALSRDTVAMLCSEMPTRTLEEGRPSGSTFGIDRSPIQLSVRVGGAEPEARWCIDADPMTDPEVEGGPMRRWEAGLRIAKRLEAKYGAHVRVFEELADIMTPRGFSPRMAFGSAAPMRGKARFHGYISGSRVSAYRDRLYEATTVLGMRRFADQIWKVATPDEMLWPSVDLIEGPQARSKLYVTFNSYDVDRIHQYRDLAGSTWPVDDIPSLMNTLYGERPTSEGTGPLLCFHLRQGEVAGTTLHLPCCPFEFDLAEDRLLTDGDLRRRILAILSQFGVDPEPYEKAIHQFAVTSLEDEMCIHEFITFFRDARGLSLTSYFGPRFFARRFGFA